MNVQVLKAYTQQGLYREVDIFNHPWEYPDLTRILGFRFLLQWGRIEASYKSVPNKVWLGECTDFDDLNTPDMQ